MNRMIVGSLLIAGSAAADAPYVYPAQGQSAEQQKQDQFECYQWAAEQSGFDPVAGPAPATTASPTTTPDSTSDSGGAGKAVLGGATKGAVIAEVSDGDAGKGAAAGAVMGVRKGKRQKKQEQAAAQHEAAAAQERARAEAEAQQRQLRENYDRANTACLEGRGYTVK